jgi:uncharacterized membrane protein
VEMRGRDLARGSLHAGWAILLFTLFTAEVVDYVATLLPGVSTTQAAGLGFAREMALLCVWMAYALPLVYFALRKNVLAVLVAGLTVAGVVVAFVVVWGLAFRPIEEFRLLLNVRMLAGVFVLGGLVAIGRWLKEMRGNLEVADIEYPLVLTCQAVLLLLLLSGEIRDTFERQMFVVQYTSGTLVTEETMKPLQNMEQLSLSMLWLLYGIALIVVGIWRRKRGMRMLAIVILGTAILKIFIYDLSFLQTLYRIFSFMGLGVILLAASYLYQRYKSFIIGDGADGGGPKQP